MNSFPISVNGAEDSGASIYRAPSIISTGFFYYMPAEKGMRKTSHGTGSFMKS
jgi:hypothetical protein